ncbi:polysaccharide deacetylase family protein [Maribacter sp. 2210JD10-5]|uniref:polysaccharide deacetylase family protein n=1 Tax=Maribacter sp. 2210JD10-5 TaxID=3386272 RepID=UPI0039BD8F2F
MLLVYTHKITPRFSYIMKHIFTRILGIEVGFTTKVEEFIKHSEVKITFTKQPLQNEFFIRSHDLLFEQGINDIDINVMNWEGVPCFFPSGERSTIPFDIFSASFFLLSRYEEYLPHVKDIHGRFSPKDSIAYQNKFLQRPVVDIWAFKFLAVLKERFPDLEHKQRIYKYESVIDVTTSHSYAYRGVFRGMSGLFLDLFTLRFRKVYERVSVWLKIKKDPYDNFAQLVEWHKKYQIKSTFFFQFAEYSRYDKNIATNNNKFQSLIKYIADYSTVALAASYSSFDDIEVLKIEKSNLENVINRSISTCKMRFNRVDVPDTYRNLLATEFSNDYTMGYTQEIGFRAGTCTPFYLYDIPLEVQQPIKIHPFAIHDYALLKMKNTDQVKIQFDAIYHEIKKVQGSFKTIFSNELLGEDSKLNWLDIYETMLKNYNV